MFKIIALTTAVLSAVSTCSSQEESTPAPTSVVQRVQDVLPKPVAAMRQEQFALLYVRADAQACANVWAAGVRLPANYEWCSDDKGEPVAGVRMGSCEVVAFDNRLYAVPGTRIRQVRGEITSDQRYLRALTTCPLRGRAQASGGGHE